MTRAPSSASAAPSRGEFDETFPLAAVLSLLKKAAGDWPPPGMEAVAGQGGTPFAVLTGTLLSLRTRDETALAALRRLRKLAPTAERMAGLPEETIARAIYPAAFFRVKARRLKALAGIVCRRHGGEVPARMESLLALPGVGRKTANLTLSLGFGKAAVCVDAHVHRILNRLGALATGSPEATESWLRARLPRRKWSGINSVLVPFGQNLCTPRSPRCSRCPAAEFCLRVGVARSR